MNSGGPARSDGDEPYESVNVDLDSMREFAQNVRSLCLELESVQIMLQRGDANVVTAFGRLWQFQFERIDPVNLSAGSFDDGRELSGVYKSEFYDPKVDHVARLSHAMETAAEEAEDAADTAVELDLEFEAFFKRVLDDE